MAEPRKDLSNLPADKLRLLMERLRKQDQAAAPRIGRAPRDGGPLPLSFAQERLWFLDRLAPGDAAYHIPIALRLAGPLDRTALRGALEEVVRRHEPLRATFGERDGLPHQEIGPAAEVPLPLVDLAGLPVEHREEEALRRSGEESRRPFDLSRGPLLRTLLFRLGEGEHTLLLTLHHIVADGWSLGVLLREVGNLYPAMAAGHPSPLPELAVQYVDYAVWQRERFQGEFLASELAFWRERLAGLPPLELPADRIRPASSSFRGRRWPLRLAAGEARALRELARGEEATLFMALLTLFKTLLLRYTGQTDFAVGSPVANRDHRETEGLVGLFVNTVSLRTRLGGDPTVRELLRRVRETTLAAYGHAELPFGKLVEELEPERQPGRNPLFQALLTLQSQPLPAMRIGGLDLVPFDLGTDSAKLDLSASWREHEEELVGALELSADLFEAATAERMARHAVALLREAPGSPDRRLSELSMLSPEERRQLVVDWNGAPEPGAPGETLDRLIVAQAARTPGNAALVREDGSVVTYAELDHLSDRLAGRLRRLGVGPDIPVGVHLERSAELVIAMLAVWKAGGAHLPLDPAYPRERLAFMLEDSGAPVVIARRPEPLAAGVRTVLFDMPGEEAVAGASAAALPRGLAYVLYTSGSTGQPKGVGVEHEAAVRHFRTIVESWELTAEDRVLQIHSPSFDPWFEDTVAPLLCGAAVVVCGPEVWEPARLLHRAAGLGVTAMPLPTTLWDLWVRESAQGPQPEHRVRMTTAGGEAMAGETARLWWRSPLSRIRLYNGYGPTETVVTIRFHEIGREAAERAEAAVEIGSPYPGRTAYVLDRDGGLLPPGVPGELFLGGQVLGRGYAGRPDLTAERYLPDPHAAEWGGAPGARMYRTGDLARRRPDGILEFLGRVDHQVKVRGYRVELGEIEATLGRHPAVSRVAVAPWKAPAGDTRLAAFIVPVPGADLDAAALPSYLAAVLPAFMIPSAFTVLGSLPLTPNNKVDRKALERMAAESGRETVGGSRPPGTPAEEMVAGVWAELLGLPAVGAEDDFFALGGHSLLAMRVVSRLRSTLGLELPLRLLFERPTVAAVAELVEAARRATTPGIRRAPRDGAPSPLSFAQTRLWFLDRLEPGNPAYNIPAGLRLTGMLSIPAFAAALREIARRHEILRTIFAEVAGEPVQVIHEGPGLPPAVVDLSGLPPGRREDAALGLAREEARLPFDLERGPVARAALLRLAADDHVALFTFHHIVSDAWSTGVLARELTVLYQAFAAGCPSPLPELPIQYADFSSWQREWLRGEVLESLLAFWRDRLAGLPAPLELPSDRPRQDREVFRAAAEPLALPGGLMEGIDRLGRGRGATLFMTLLAAFEALLHRYTGREDFTVGTPVANRDRTEIEGLIGFFVNTLVLRADLSGDPGFAGLLDRVRASALAAYSHQDLPFERLVEELLPERDLAHTPLFQVFFTAQATPLPDLDFGPGLSATPVESGAATAKFDLSLNLGAGPRGWEGELKYDAGLFDRAAIQRLAGHFQTLLAGISAAPGARISELPLLSPEERRQALVSWNETGPASGGRPVHEAFEEQAARTPDAVALVFEESSLTLRELDGWANGLAWRLRGLGVGPEVRVGLCAEPSLSLIPALLGILKAGGAYVPLDPQLPAERLASMLEDSGARALVVPEELRERFGDVGIPVIEPEAGETAAAPGRTAGPENLAYVIYTSGSTGRPKGVMVEHRQLSAYVGGVLGRMELPPGSSFATVSTLAADLGNTAVFSALASGGALHVISRDRLLSPELLGGRAVDCLKIVPSHLAALVGGEGAARVLPKRLLVTGGEACPRALVQKVRELAPECRVLNHYGPTETTVGVLTYPTWEEEDRGGAALPLGRPLPGVRAYVVDWSLQPLPAGIPGELLVGGPQVSRGYLGRPDLTAEKFVPDPFGGKPGARLYRTGDLARRRPDGAVEFLGRIDLQVKVRGFRVEPGEVESVLAAQPGVRAAAVLARPDEAGGHRLVAYIVGAVPADLDRRLPAHMVPSGFVLLSDLPLTPNGKVDRRALAGIVPEAAPAGREHVPPRNAAEEALARVWAEVLGVERVGVQDDFFALGGHSLLGVRLLSGVEEAFGVRLPVRTLFQATTLGEMAERIAEARGGGKPEPIGRAPRDGGPLPLSFAQERLWFLDRFAPGSAVYNVPSFVRLRGCLDVEALRRTLAEVTRRHESLRTTFGQRDGVPFQVVAPPGEVALPLVDLQGGEDEMLRFAGEEARRPFDLARGPLFRGSLLRLAPEDHVLLLNIHHIVSDGWSRGVLIREVAALYGALEAGRPSPLPEPAIQYADYAVWQRDRLRGETLEAELAFWRERLAGTPPLEMPSDRPRPPRPSFRGGLLDLDVPEDVAGHLRALCRKQDVTSYMALLAAFQTLLLRYSGQTDFAVGSPVANRGRRETEGVIGFFVNTLALRVDLSGRPAFRELLWRVREAALDAFSHEEMPFERIVEDLQPERQEGRNPVFQVMLALQNQPWPALAMAGLEVSAIEVETGTAKVDLGLTWQEREGRLLGTLEYSSDLFEAASAGRMARHAVALLRGALAAPERTLWEVPLLSLEERRQLVVDWNGAPEPGAPETTLDRLIAAQAARTPGNVALVREDGSTVTYAELDRLSDRLARRLVRLGVGPDMPVGVHLRRSAGLVISLLAIWKAGGAHLPLDPAYPAERLAFMLEDSGAGVVITLKSLASSLPASGARTLILDSTEEENAGEAPAGALPRGLAYVLYTSGSTGRPKAVAVEHEAAVRHFRTIVGSWELTEEDRVLMIHSPSFDPWFEDTVAPLLRGSAVVICGPETWEPARLLFRAAELGVTVMPLPTTLWDQWVRDSALGPQPEHRVRMATAGGEAMSGEVARLWWRSPLSRIRLVNGYGPTEAVVTIRFHDVSREAAERAEGSVEIGSPYPGRTAYVLDREGGLLPPGVPGELCLGGQVLGRGYFGRPDLTAERYLPDPFASKWGGEPGSRLYRTGDLARRRPDGILEFLGRTDHQVKVRGFRIELEEIEAALSRHPAVGRAVVVDWKAPAGDTRLAAFVVPAAEPAPAGPDLRSHLETGLPSFMVPAAFTVLESLPLTPNGKVDRKALARMAAETAPAAAEHVPPRNGVEELLAGLWEELLGTPQVGVHDDFFALGGHSLLAIRLISKVDDLFGVRLPVRDLFHASTLGAMAERIAEELALLLEGSAREAERIARGPRTGEPPPLSFAQERLWFLDRFAPGNPVYNMPAAARLTGRLDVPALRRTLQELARRHESLRTTFGERDGVPFQVIAPTMEIPLPVVDLHGDEEEMLRLVREEARRPFDLARGPLFRAALLRLTDEDHVLLQTVHHIVSDGWSQGLLIQETAAIYGALAAGRPSPLPEPALQYADYAVWQRGRLRGETLEAELAFWRQRLAGVPSLDMPADRRRPQQPSFQGGARELAVPGDLPDRLRAFCRRQGVTSYMALLASFQTLLLRYSGQTDFAVGSPVANRNRSELEEIVGLFVNTLALRVDLSGDPTFRELALRVREVVVAAFAHEEMPFERIVADLHPERDPGRNPVFQVSLALQNQPRPKLAMGGLDLAVLGTGTGTAKVDMSLVWQEEADGLLGILEYSADLFDAATADRMAHHAVALLRTALEEPGRRLQELSLLSPEERRQLVVDWNGVPGLEAPEETLDRLIAAQAGRTPDNVALVREDGTTLTYAELDRLSGRLARRLQDLGVGPERPVGVHLQRSAELVISLLAAWKAGGAYLPLDPAYPAGRLGFMLEDSGAGVVITLESLAPSLPETGARVLVLDAPGKEGPGEEVVPAGASPRHLAYILYTSGSTGRPKAVAVEHEAAVRHFRDVAGIWNLTELDRVLQIHSPSFDPWFEETVVPLLRGAAVVICGPEVWSPARLLLQASELGVNVMALPTSFWDQWVREVAAGGLPDHRVRSVIVGGEAMSGETARLWWRSPLSRIQLYNAYGPTEIVVTLQFHEVSAEAAERAEAVAVEIGLPASGRTAYILDRDGCLLPPGVPGELCLGGRILGRGYLGRPDLTAAKFVPDPFAAEWGGEPGSRMYRTGDLARRRPDGILEFLGRIDHQVKVRGFRIELGEIEETLARHAAVHRAVVVDWKTPAGDTRLAAFVVPAAEPAPEAAGLRDFLGTTLPAFMVPSSFTMLEALPRTVSGKVDRKALARMAAETSTVLEEHVAPRNPVEELLASLWEEVLGVSRAGAHDDFFALGGHSLLAIRLISKVEGLFGVRLPVRDLFQAPTLGGMAARVAGEMAAPGAERDHGEAEIRRVPRGSGPLPLSFAQERLWFLDRFAPGSAVYNIPSFLRLGGLLDAVALRGALTEVARRHESLRTTFGEREGVPFQAISPAAEAPLPLADLSGLPAAAREDEALRLIMAEARSAFDLERGPLFRAALLRLGGEDHVLSLNLHHIVSDGWSQGLLIRELAALYHALAAGRPSPLPEPPIQYADYVVWQRSRLCGETLEKELAFWRERLAGVPLLEMPSDRPRPPRPSFRGGRRSLDVPADLADRLRAFCREEEVTFYMALLAAFQVLLLRYSGQSDFAVGSPVANRSRGEVEGLIGLFINTLALRADLSGRPAFRELLRRVREAALTTWSHEEVPFEKVVEGLAIEREAGRNPVFQVILAVDSQVWPDLVMGGLEVAAIDAGTGTAKLDLALVWQEREGRLLGKLEHSSDLFDDASAERMARHAVTLLQAALEAPDQPLGELPMLSSGEVRQLVMDWNGAPLPDAAEQTLDRLVAAQAALAPERVAVVYEDGSTLTYGDLERRSDRLALRLQRLGVGPDVPVGVLLQRSPELVISLLAAWKAGGAYLPLDPSYPGDRLAFMLEDSGARVVITLESLAQSVPGNRVQVLALDAPEDEAAGGEAPAGALPRGLAYVLYTSGSTGLPKAVGVEHEGLIRHLRNIVASWELTAEDRVLMLHSPSFDPCFEDVVAPLLSGGGVVICGPEVWEPSRFLSRASDLGVTVMPLPTTLWDGWVRETSLVGLPEHRVRMVTSGGEAMSGETARLWWRSPLAKIRLLNGYGPTEAVIAMKYHDIDGVIAERTQGAVEIGSPYPGRTAYVLDPDGGLTPPGVPGELCLGGEIMGRGYIGRPDLTAERFVPDPFAAAWGSEPGGRMYRTGDLARRRPDGILEFLGRIDHQVKVRGFRIELGEIEAALDRHPGVGRAVVVTWKSPAGDTRLAAFVVPAADPAPTAAGLRAYLAAILPAFMVPSAFTFLESLPLTTSHKVDRRALARMAAQLPSTGDGYVAPRNVLEEILAPLWAEVLGVERIGAHDDFFALGGHSLLAIRLISKVDDTLGVRLPVGAMFHASTLGEMAERIAEELAAQAGDEFLRQISAEREEYEESSHG